MAAPYQTMASELRRMQCNCLRRPPVKRHRTFTMLCAAVAGLAIAACQLDAPSAPNVAGPSPSPAPQPSFVRDHPHLHIMPLIGQLHPSAASVGAVTTDNGIYYHGGPIIYAQKVAAIYWSNGTIYSGGPAPGATGRGSADGPVVGYFLNSLRGSPYYNINTTYIDAARTPLQHSANHAQLWAPH